MKKRLIASVTCLSMLLIMLLGSTIAWFTDQEFTESTMTVGKVSIKQNVDKDTKEIVPNDPFKHTVTVKNDGSQSAYFRTLFAFEDGNYIDEQGNAQKVLDMITLSGANAANIVIPSPKIQFAATKDGKTTLYTVGYYLHANELAVNDTATVMESFELKNTADPNWGLAVGDTYDILVLSQACQVVGMDGYNAAGALDLSFGPITSSNCVSWFEAKLGGFVGRAMTGTGALDGATAVEITVKENNSAVLYANIPGEAVANADEEIEVIYSQSTYVGNFTVAAGEETHVVDVTVSNLKPDNTTPVTVKLFIPAGLDPNTVKLYHYDEEIICTYDPNDGSVTFHTTTFSPFTVVYEADSVHTPTDPEIPEGSDKPEGLPEANVVNSPEYENVDLPWESFGQWSPTENLDSQLEAAYTFSCQETLEEAEANDFAYWYCDFVVKLDRDLGANQIFLGGNYGTFGWVGFHNGDLTLEANEEIPLLGSVTKNPWTYVDVVQSVGTFICGVGDVDDALAGATFTVMLRLTNPEDETEFYNVATIEYTFVETVEVSNETDLQAAMTAGKNVVLQGDITVSNPLTIPADKEVVLDLNNHSITMATDAPKSLITNNGKLNIVGEGEIAITFNGTVNNGVAANAISNRGVMAVNGATITNTGVSNQIGYAIDNYNGATLVVNSGTISASGSSYYDGIRLFCGSNETVVTVNGGDISTIWAQNPSANKAIEVKGTVIVNGGTIDTVYYENYTTVQVKEGLPVNVADYGAGTVADPVTEHGYTVYAFVNP